MQSCSRHKIVSRFLRTFKHLKKQVHIFLQHIMTSWMQHLTLIFIPKLLKPSLQ
jgi:hypothetical protein